MRPPGRTRQSLESEVVSGFSAALELALLNERFVNAVATAVVVALKSDASFRSADLVKSNPDDRRAYPIREIVRLTGIGRSSVYNAIRAGNLRASRLAGRTLVLRTDLDEWLATSRVVKPSPGVELSLATSGLIRMR